MRCSICGMTIETREEAMEAGWEPYFYERETEHEFACPSCAEEFLQEDEDGEMEVKVDYHGKLVYLDQERTAGKGSDCRRSH